MLIVLTATEHPSSESTHLGRRASATKLTEQLGPVLERVRTGEELLNVHKRNEATDRSRSSNITASGVRGSRALPRSRLVRWRSRLKRPCHFDLHVGRQGG